MLYLFTVADAPPADNTPLLESCLQRAASNDITALSDLYLHTKTAVYALSLSILKNAQDAEDVLHDCYLAVYSNAARYEPRHKPLAWILTIARNLCLHKLRDRRKTAELSEDEWEHVLQSATALPSEDRMLLATCLTRLTDEERQILTLHAVASFKHREIATLLTLPLPTVLSKYHRTRQKLRALLEKGEIC